MGSVSLPEAPSAHSSGPELADWLEIHAFVAADGRASIDHLVGTTEIDGEADSGDIDDDDEYTSRITGAVDVAVRERETALGAAYPFEYTEAGVLCLQSNWTESPGRVGYLFCLLVDNFAREGLLHDDAATCKPELRLARQLFQVLTTVATAGFVKGPTYSFGWPRPDRSGFHDKLRTIWAVFRDGSVVAVLPDGWQSSKDGGVDVIAWYPRLDGLPGTRFFLGQAASGADWQAKSFVPDAKTLLEQLFFPQPVSSPEFATFVPFLLEESVVRRLRNQLGSIYGRLAIPLQAEHGMSHFGTSKHTVEHADEWASIIKWLESIRLDFRSAA